MFASFMSDARVDMCHDEESSACAVDLPRQKNPVRDDGSLNAQDLEEALRDTEKLGATAFQAYAACARESRKNRV